MSNKKSIVLGMAIATATSRLRKLVLFDVLQRHKENVCYRCGQPINTVNELSIDHKIDWLNATNAQELYWDVTNIAFSHLVCNISAGGGGKVRADMIRLTEDERKARQATYDRRPEVMERGRKHLKARYWSDPEYREKQMAKGRLHK